MQETYALLWSKKSNCFHVEELSRTEQSGMSFFFKDAVNDYLLLFTGGYDAVSAKADELRHIVTERAEVRLLFEGE